MSTIRESSTRSSVAGTGAVPAQVTGRDHELTRRNLLRAGAAGAAALGLGGGRAFLQPLLAQRGLASPDGLVSAASMAWADALYTEAFPTSPLILSPFTEPLPLPQALKPVPPSEWKNWPNPPGPGDGQQSVDDTGKGRGKHQIWPTDIAGLPDTKPQPTVLEPLVYQIDLRVSTHSFTTSKVLPIDSKGRPTTSFDASRNTYPAGTVRTLPPSTIYGFNGTFPGPMINAQYGHPVLVRFENHLHENPLGLPRQDFGSPNLQFLTHLHNGHTAPESDGNPHFAVSGKDGPGDRGFAPKWSVDNLYLNWPAGGDDTEKQSFFWFHDHTMDSTGSNVYKGMVGLYPIYDPERDSGDETTGLRLPGVRHDHDTDKTFFDVDYDIPLALYDCCLDDGVTTHHDIHDTEGVFADVKNPGTHPEFWGMTFYKHFPNHGFVGDIFTVNGKAFPVLKVKRRKYRLRFLDASVSRIYELKLMSSTQKPKSARDLGFQDEELQGQYRIPDGQQCMRFTQISADGGLLPFPIVRDSFELWPAKRREFVVDFSQYQDGSPTTTGDEVYLTNVMKMTTGRLWSSSSRFSPDPRYKVPILKIVIGDRAEDDSVMPTAATQLRPLPPLPQDWRDLLGNRLIFEVQRGGGGGELEWLVNGVPFDATKPATSMKNPAGKTPTATPKRGSFNLWEIRNGGGGWVHPFHLHMEEHRTVMRNGKDVSVTPDRGHPDDKAREDLAALDPSESVIVYRGFRDFVGPYVAHCHNLAHEDHAMMFGWSIT
jgi:FtsP/CotA-like multicopper oxidase with cupredoxin domain